jgi:hypothetical protein
MLTQAQRTFILNHAYVPGASDLLLSKLISICSQYDKRYIHLGLGISNGIRRFKEKWGAKPTRRYKMCEMMIKKPPLQEAITP